jgi:hypothetical protein
VSAPLLLSKQSAVFAFFDDDMRTPFFFPSLGEFAQPFQEIITEMEFLNNGTYRISPYYQTYRYTYSTDTGLNPTTLFTLFTLLVVLHYVLYLLCCMHDL